MKRSWAFLAAVLFLVPAALSASPRPFPADSPATAYVGLYGFGADATTPCDNTAGHMRVWPVTNLLSSGYGSVNAALDSTMAHTGYDLNVILPKVAGWANVDDHQGTITCLYFAAQAAPGQGLHLLTGYRWIAPRGRYSHDILLRGVFSFTRGHMNQNGGVQVNLVGKREAISESMLMWAPNKMLFIGTSSPGDTTIGVTGQQNLVCQAAYPHPTPLQFTARTADGGLTDELSKVSWIGNFTCDNTHRVPQLAQKGGHYSAYRPITEPGYILRNNYSYNDGYQGMIGAYSGNIDVRTSLLEPGPMSDSRYDYMIDAPFEACYVTSACTGLPATDSTLSIFADSILGAKNTSLSTPRASLIYTDSDHVHAEIQIYYKYGSPTYPNGGGAPLAYTSVTSAIFRDTAQTLPLHPMPSISPDTLKEWAIGRTNAESHVGPYRRLTCDGSWAVRTDSLKDAMLEHARNGDGLSNPTAIDSGYVEAHLRYSVGTGTACSDVDDDYLPDDFEARYWGNDTSGVATADDDGDGYNNLQEYLAAQSPLVADSASTGPVAPGPTPNTSPVADISFSCTALVCSFDATGSSDYQGPIASYAWQFGDGGSASTDTATHTYAAAGLDTVRLIVTDDSAAADTAFVNVNHLAANSYTFSDVGRSVYVVPVIRDTTITPDSTVIPYFRADTSVVPDGTLYGHITSPAGDSMLVVISGALAGTPMDSVSVAAWLAAHSTLCTNRGVCTAAQFKTWRIPGGTP